MTETLTGRRKELPNKEILHSLFEYSDGVLYWKKRTAKCVHVGEVAGGVGARGYVRVRIFGSKYLAHRVVWAMHHDHVPKVIDHINGITSDNRIENLRQASFADNTRNSKIPKSSSTGVKGVSWNKWHQRYAAHIREDGKAKHIGFFKTMEEAKAARVAEAARIHGEFARHE